MSGGRRLIDAFYFGNLNTAVAPLALYTVAINRSELQPSLPVISSPASANLVAINANRICAANATFHLLSFINCKAAVGLKVLITIDDTELPFLKARRSRPGRAYSGATAS